MNDELVLRFCHQIRDTLAVEREDAANALKAELERQHVRLVGNLMVQLRMSEKDLQQGLADQDPERGPGYSLLGDPSSIQERSAQPLDPERDIQLLDSSQGYRQGADVAPSGANGKRDASANANASTDVDAVPAKTVSRRPSVLPPKVPTGETWMYKLVQNPKFEAAILAIILLNIAAIAVDVQMSGLDLGYKMSYTNISSSPEITMQWARSALDALDFMFGIIFTLEIVLKVVGWKLEYFRYAYSWLDIAIVGAWLVETVFDASFSSFSPFILRIVRLLKVLRLLRLARHVEYLDSLFLLVESIKASRSVVLWSTVLLVAIQMGVAIVLNQSLRGYMEDETNALTARHEIFKYFGTFFRSNVTMFELTFGNFTTVLRLLQDIWGWYAVIIITFKVLVGFVALRIISGIFMTETLRVCNNNDHIMVLQRRRKQKGDLEKMTKLFKHADHSGDGHVTEEEFLTLFEEDATVKLWLAAQDLDVVDLHELFLELAGRDDTITAEEMIAGVKRLKGFAKASDVQGLIKDLDSLIADHKETQEFQRALLGAVRVIDAKVGRLAAPCDTLLMYQQGAGPAMRVSHC